MLRRIIGPCGSGKTEVIMEYLGKAIKSGKRCFLIVPEQQSVERESLLCERFGDECNMYCEVLNFERLPNRVAREYGGLTAQTVRESGRAALLSLISAASRESLSEYAPVCGEEEFADSLYTLFSRLKARMIGTKELRGACALIPREESRVKRKLSDIALLYSQYEEKLAETGADPRDGLTRLAEELHSKPFFRGSYVFIDSYYTFTAQEYAVIKELAAQCAELFITFACEKDTPLLRPFFAENAKCAEIIKSFSPHECEDIYLPDVRRFSGNCLAALERSLWADGASEYLGADASVRFITAADRFGEVDAAAAVISAYVRAGGRYRDIALLAGDPDKYRGLVGAAFRRDGIPVYISAKEDTESKPLISFITGCIDAVSDGFSLASVKKVLKSGFARLTTVECDALISYADAWKLRGKTWISDTDWQLDPEGYNENGLSERAERQLKTVNRAKRKLSPMLSELYEGLGHGEDTAAHYAEFIYGFLIKYGCDETLRRRAQRLLKHGRREEADREIQLWKLVIGIIDDLYSLCGTYKVTPARVSGLIKLMCGRCPGGAIPAVNDAVTFGSASLMRAGNKKLVIVLGMCDGEFPALPQKNEFFDRYEESLLESAELCISDGVEKEINSNMFLVYAAVAAPTQSLVLISPESDIGGEELRKSGAWYAARRLLPNVCEENGSTLVSTAQSVAAMYPLMRRGAQRELIGRALVQRGVLFYDSAPSAYDPRSRIIFRADRVTLSPTSFEKYIGCPFSYFGEKLLLLKEKKENRWEGANIGQYVHKMLCDTVRGCVQNGRFIAPTDAELDSRMNKLSEDYFQSFLGKEAAADKQFMNTFRLADDTVRRAAKEICVELSKGSFVPSGFEYRIGLRDPDTNAIRFKCEKGSVFLTGSIDRVDIYTAPDGRKYARVVDYKTYDKSLDPNRVGEGFDTQMLHYLFAYCDSNGTIPAAAEYVSVAEAERDINAKERDPEVPEYPRRGLVLDNTDIIDAMGSRAFLPIKLTKSGIHKSYEKYVLSEEGFESVRKTVGEYVVDVGNRILDGKTDIAPCTGAKESPCKYCIMKPVCRKSSFGGGNGGESDEYAGDEE